MIKMTKWKALFMAGVMVMSMGATAFAAEEAQQPANVGAEVTKNLEFAEGITVPNATFKFNITKVTSDAPDASIADIIYSNDSETGDLTDGKFTAVQKTDITFGSGNLTGAAAFPHAGVYQYTVKETANTYTIADVNDETMTYDTTEYTLYVYVENDAENGLKISQITAEADGAENKASSILFTNTYTKRGGSEMDKASLTITKNTTGTYADKTKDFTFTIMITKAATASDISYTGKIGNEEVVCKVGQATTFTLHDGESLVFDSLPAGTRYVVSETGAEDGYTPSISVVENGVTTKNNEKATNEISGIASADTGETNLVGEKTNNVTFTNEYQDVPVTGIIVNVLPFVILIGAAVLAFAVMAMVRRRNCR